MVSLSGGRLVLKRPVERFSPKPGAPEMWCLLRFLTYGAISIQLSDLTLYDFYEILFSASTFTNEVYFPVSAKVIINGTEYRKGVLVLMGRYENGDHVFRECFFYFTKIPYLCFVSL